MNPRLHLQKGLYRLGFIGLIYLSILIIRELYLNEGIDETNAVLNKTYDGSNNEAGRDIAQVSNTTDVLGSFPTCPGTPPLLRGHLDIVDVHLTSLNLNLSTNYGGEVERGGIWRPKNCKARKKVAFMIPFRNRWEQLNTFLNHMHPVFQRQQLDYRIFVVEQVNLFYNNC